MSKSGEPSLRRPKTDVKTLAQLLLCHNSDTAVKFLSEPPVPFEDDDRISLSTSRPVHYRHGFRGQESGPWAPSRSHQVLQEDQYLPLVVAAYLPKPCPHDTPAF